MPTTYDLQMQDDDLTFAEPDEPEAASGAKGAAEPWQLLIVDDEEEVHSVTTLAMSNFRFDGRPLAFLHAYSGAQAREIVRDTPDIGLILLDVIMETDDAGLQVARYIREELHNPFVRIILRTGQPGHAPERTIINNYDINDYKEKTELTSTKLYTVVHTGLASYRDLIALDRTSRELAAANESLRQTAEDMEHFAYIASHDMQAPLRTISAFADQLEFRYGPQLDGKAMDLLQRMGKAAARLRRMIQALLQLSKAGQNIDLNQAVDVGHLARNVLDNLTISIQESGTIIKIDDLPEITGNAPLLEELLTNLIQNAIKYRDAERPCSIRISAHEDEAEWRFHISDNGIGIASEDCERVFNVFERAHDRRSYDGSGIGLATCRRIVERHHGKIWIESEPDQGTTVSFSIPKPGPGTGSTDREPA